MAECADGDYVRFDDVQPLLERLRQFEQAQADARPVAQWQWRWKGDDEWRNSTKENCDKALSNPQGLFEVRALYTAPPAESAGAKIVALLREARATLEMWKDVAPAVSLCADIDKALSRTRAADGEAGESKEWRCFHCDAVFADAESAVLHFGTSEIQPPACQIDIAEYRAMELRVRRCNEEDTDLHREIHGLQAKHQVDLRREEEKGYARGLSDGMKEAAQQQAEPTTGEEIHVNVSGGDVYTLPLQASGMDKPRFVVHVPASEEAAAHKKDEEAAFRAFNPLGYTMMDGWVVWRAACEWQRSQMQTEPMRLPPTTNLPKTAYCAAQQAGPGADERAAWFAALMEAGAALENASYAIGDKDAERTAIGAAKHARERANALWAAQSGQRAGVAITSQVLDAVACYYYDGPHRDVHIVNRLHADALRLAATTPTQQKG